MTRVNSRRKCAIDKLKRLIYGPCREKLCLWRFANNTGADQPAHPRSLISAFVIHFLENFICKLANCYWWNFNFLDCLCSWGDWFESRFDGNPEDRFSRDEAHMIYSKKTYFSSLWRKYAVKLPVKISFRTNINTRHVVICSFEYNELLGKL